LYDCGALYYLVKAPGHAKTCMTTPTKTGLFPETGGELKETCEGEKKPVKKAKYQQLNCQA